MMGLKPSVLALLITLFLVGCSSQHALVQDSAPSGFSGHLQHTPDAIPKIEPKSRGGNPVSYNVFGETYHVMPSSTGFVQRGSASWYGTKFHGNKTSNGETYDMYAMTAAHKTLPIPTYLHVQNLKNGKNIIVRVNDRGPFHGGRIIDLSYAAAIKLDLLSAGTAPVEIRAIDPSQYQRTRAYPLAQPVVVKPYPAQPNNLAIQHHAPQTTTAEPRRAMLYLQAGAFGDVSNANKLRAKLAQQAIYNVRMTTDKSNAELLYRIQIGPFASTNLADSMRLKLQQLGIFNSHYMRY